jgi:hypothetical protein
VVVVVVVVVVGGEVPEMRKYFESCVGRVTVPQLEDREEDREDKFGQKIAHELSVQGGHNGSL